MPPVSPGLEEDQRREVGAGGKVDLTAIDNKKEDEVRMTSSSFYFMIQFQILRLTI